MLFEKRNHSAPFSPEVSQSRSVPNHIWPWQFIGTNGIAIIVMLPLLLIALTSSATDNKIKQVDKNEFSRTLLNKMQLQKDRLIYFIKSGKNFTHSQSHGTAGIWKIDWNKQQRWCEHVKEIVSRHADDIYTISKINPDRIFTNDYPEIEEDLVKLNRMFGIDYTKIGGNVGIELRLPP